MKIRMALLCTAAVLAFAGNALAESKVNTAARAEIAAIGKKWDADVGKQDVAIYGPILEKQEAAHAKDITVQKEISYGSDPKQTLDVAQPTKKHAGAPIVIFIHGGGLTGGDKSTYASVPLFFARHGMVGINANYRLSPQVKWPEEGRDVASVVAWAKSHAKELGGDPNKVFAIGNSAGGTNLANYIYQPDLQPGGNPGLAGAVLMSGVYSTSKEGPRRQVSVNYYGEDESQWETRVPYGQAKVYKGKPTPTLITNAELNPNNIEVEGANLLQLLCQKDQCPRYHQSLGVNHGSEAFSLNADDSSVGPAILDFIRTTLKGAAPAKMVSAK
jgi:acetyl esterase/lipase